MLQKRTETKIRKLFDLQNIINIASAATRRLELLLPRIKYLLGTKSFCDCMVLSPRQLSFISINFIGESLKMFEGSLMISFALE